MTFVRSHADAIEADFQRFYGLDLWSDHSAGRLTLRRIAALVAHLPSDAATWVDVHGQHAAWSVTDDLLAAVLTALQGANWQRSGGKGQRPTPVTRPRSALSDRKRLDRLRSLRERIERSAHGERQ